jgi:hypothetical protein
VLAQAFYLQVGICVRTARGKRLVVFRNINIGDVDITVRYSCALNLVAKARVFRDAVAAFTVELAVVVRLVLLFGDGLCREA